MPKVELLDINIIFNCIFLCENDLNMETLVTRPLISIKTPIETKISTDIIRVFTHFSLVAFTKKHPENG